jgi:hypothetical protein
MGTVMPTCLPSHTESINSKIVVQSSLGKVRPYPQNDKNKRIRGVSQMVEYLPSKNKALNSNTSTTKKQTKK